MPIDLSAEEFRRLGYRAVDLIAEHMAALAGGLCRTPVADADRRALIDEPLPLRGADPDALLDDVASTILRYPMGNSSPRFFAWVNSSAAPIAVLAELLAAGPTRAWRAATRQPSKLAPADANRAVPGQAGLTSGGSVANLIGPPACGTKTPVGRVHMVGDQPPLVVYTSSEVTAAFRKPSSCWASATRISADSVTPMADGRHAWNAKSARIGRRPHSGMQGHAGKARARSTRSLKSRTCAD